MESNQDRINIELRTERIEEFLGSTPNWLIRRGITIFACVIISLIIFCAFCKYPQVYEAPITITTEHPTIWILAQSSGKLDSIFVDNKSQVTKNDILAAISTTAKVSDMFALKDYLEQLSPFISRFDHKDLFIDTSRLHLGELQGDYMQFQKVLSEYDLFASEKFHETIELSLQKEITEYKEYLTIIEEQYKVRSDVDVLIQNKFERDSIIFSVKGMSASDFEKTKKDLLYSKLEISQSNLSANEIRVNLYKIEQLLLEQRNNYKSNLTSYKATIISLYEQLSSKIDAWDNLYVIRAPANGIVDFSLIWSKNQYVQAGDKSFAIIPHQTGDTIGKCLYSVSGIGKIKTGQPVTIKLDGYPYLEYGVLRGNVRSISSIPIEVQTQNGIEKFISIEVDLCANFNTSYHYTIPYAGELTGTSEIIIENRSLLQHFFNPLKYLWNNNIADRK